MADSASTIQIELTRDLAASHIKLGQQYRLLAEWLTAGKTTGALVTAEVAPVVAASPAIPTVTPPALSPYTVTSVVEGQDSVMALQVAPPVPVTRALPKSIAATSASATPTGRVRRTKAQIAADEAAIAAGYLNAEDMASKAGGIAAAPSATVPAPPVQSVSNVSNVQQPPLPIAPVAPAFTGPSVEDLIAHFQEMIATVENAGWTGHGEGQAGTLLQKLGYQSVHTVPQESRQTVIDWIIHFKAEFLAGKLAHGTATDGFIS